MAQNKETVRTRLRVTDLIPRIICVFLAIVIWLYVIYNDEPDYEKSFDGIQVAITNTALLTDRNLAIYGDDVTMTTIVITGRRGDILAYSAESISAIADVSSITEPGKYNLPISPEVPEGATVISYYPREVSVTVQQVAEKKASVSVKPRLMTSFVKGDPISSVSEVTVKGPASVLESVSHVEARPAFDEPVTASVSASAVELVACTKSGTVIDSPYLDITPSEVDVEIPIYCKKELSATITPTGGYLSKSNSTITVVPSTISVRAKITSSNPLDGLESISVASLDETTLKNTDKATLEVVLPSGIENVSGFKTVDVTVRHRNTVKKSVTVENIMLANPENLEYTLLSKSIDVVVRATIPYSLELDAAEISLVGSLSDAQNGKVPLTVILPERFGNSVYALGEYYAEIRVNG